MCRAKSVNIIIGYQHINKANHLQLSFKSCNCETEPRRHDEILQEQAKSGIVLYIIASD